MSLPKLPMRTFLISYSEYDQKAMSMGLIDDWDESEFQPQALPGNTAEVLTSYYENFGVPTFKDMFVLWMQVRDYGVNKSMIEGFCKYTRHSKQITG